MMTYMSGENILFSNDAFGQHYASDLMYNDLVDQGNYIKRLLNTTQIYLTPF